MGLVVGVGLYALWAVTIAVTMFWVAVASLLVTVLVFTLLYFREVFAGGRTAVLLLMTVLYALVGVVVAFWLVQPPLHGVLGSAVAAIGRDGLGGVIPYMVPLLYQAVGALASFAVLLSSIGVCIANVSAVLMEIRSPGHSWLWKWLFAATRATTSPRVGWFYFALAILALLLSSGLVVEWVSNIPSPKVLHRADAGDEYQRGSHGLEHDEDDFHAGSGECGQPGPEDEGDGDCTKEHVGAVGDTPACDGGEGGECEGESDPDEHGGPCRPQGGCRFLPCGE